MRTCKLYKAADVLVITTPAGKPRRRRNGEETQPHKISVYLVTDAKPDPKVAWPVFRLEKLTGGRETWTVHVDASGASCDCGDSTFRRQNTQEGCKHTLALRGVGLIP